MKISKKVRDVALVCRIFYFGLHGFAIFCLIYFNGPI